MIPKITQPGSGSVGMPVYVTLKRHNIHMFGTYCVLGTTPGLRLHNLIEISPVLLKLYCAFESPGHGVKMQIPILPVEGGA